MMTFALAFAILILVLALGIWFAAVLDGVFSRQLSGHGTVGLLAPFHASAVYLTQQRLRTEAPDQLNWFLSIAGYLSVAATGLAVVPFGPDLAVIGLDTSVVFWGACESPAQSLALRDIVASQETVWNVIRQPLGLPLFLLLGLSLTLRGPFDYADSDDLAGGTSAEDSGANRAGWQVARLAMLVGFSAVASTAFLGGYLGPVLPGFVWVIIKTLVVMAIVIGLSHLLVRLPVARMLGLIWKILLPISFLDLLWAGLVALA